jgi:hypothetical protein
VPRVRASLCVAIFAVMASCAPAEEAEVRELCDAYCECQGITRLDRNTCYQSCTSDLDADEVPPWCIDCVAEDSCLALEQCVEVCFGGGRAASEESL